MDLCVIYTATDIPAELLEKLINDQFGQQQTPLSLENSGSLEISVDKNMDYSFEAQHVFPDGFLFFKLRVELYFPADQSMAERIKITADILNWLWHQQIPAVAGCDYEDLLPYKGGYKEPLLPWPKR